MTDWNTASDEDFRATFRSWLAQHCRPQWRRTTARPFHRLRGEEMVAWLRALLAGGWRAPDWPQEHGGMGLSLAKQKIYHEELERQDVARVIDFGEQMLGPVVMKYGTPAQQAEILPKILNCEEIWCQGYSEPGAGSDLASLRTTARLEGDAFVVDGQKIWTTHAQDSTHMFALVRTGRFERKQQGISFLLIDLRAPGVTVRPIVNIAGEAEFCEVFLEGVRTPAANLVGELHQGWTVAKALLGHERIWVGSPAQCRRALTLAAEVLARCDALEDATTTESFARLAAELHNYEALYDEVSAEAVARGGPGPDVVMLKVLATELQQRICEFTASACGEYGGVVGEIGVGGALIDVHWQLMMSRPITIFGGANAVQRDILAKAVLELP